MIQISNVEVYGITRSVYSARNAMNSWEYSDSDLEGDKLGEKDFSLAMSLAKSGTDHRKFMRMMIVQMDILAPRYWWTEYDTYKVGTVANSCSTMHKIHAKEFTLDDFSHEHLNAKNLARLEDTIRNLNEDRERYLNSKAKGDWWQLIQMLPQSYNQLRTVSLNYEVLANMYHARFNHKLYEWRDFCKWIETLPYSKLITEAV